MNHFVQYHNADKRGLDGLLARTTRTRISTARPSVRTARGIVYLIVGIGRPRQYYLWEAFVIERVRTQADGSFIAEGPCLPLTEPVRLTGRDFDQFRRACANLIGFRQIDDLPYLGRLKALCGRSGSTMPGPLSEQFLRQLQVLLPANSPHRASVERALGGSGETASTYIRGASSGSRAPRRSSLRTLSVCQPQAEAIMRGTKRIEYRSIPTRVRERIQIYASRTRYSSVEEARRMREYRLTDVAVDDLPRGKLIGTIELVDCTFDGQLYHWHLRSPQRAEKLLVPRRRPQPVWFYPF